MSWEDDFEPLSKAQNLDESAGAEYDEDLEDEEEEVALQYETVFDWFEEVFSELVERHVTDASDKKWCAHWHEHPEVFVRITALWRSWEHLSTDPDTGMSVWMRDHLDHHLNVIISPTGPLERCRIASPGNVHEIAERLPSEITAAAAKRAMLEVA